MKQKGNCCEHSGKRYVFTPATKIYRMEGRLTSVKWRGLQAGVWIEDLSTGVKIWRCNSQYDHITGLPFTDLTTRLYKE